MERHSRSTYYTETNSDSKNKKTKMPQIKEQEKLPNIQLNEMESSNLPDTEFKIMVIRMLKELRMKNSVRTLTKIY